MAQDEAGKDWILTATREANTIYYVVYMPKYDSLSELGG
jgi:hypothetical protein